jgi:hypothetical protein
MGCKQPSATMETDFESDLTSLVGISLELGVKTHHIRSVHSSLVSMTAHIASSPSRASNLSLNTSSFTPRSTIPKSIACRARLSLWFLVRIFADRISRRIVLLMKTRRVDEVVRGRRGRRLPRRLGIDGALLVRGIA